MKIYDIIQYRMDKISMVALFGEAEKGEFIIPQLFHSVSHLHEKVGNPPPDSHGIHYAIQALLYDHSLLFFRVQEEGFSIHDYLEGLGIIKEQPPGFNLGAICTPGLGNEELIEEIASLCHTRKSILIFTETDLYDYLVG